MPLVVPQNSNVRWSNDEGTIGVVGLAPWATLDLLAKIYAVCPGTKDWHYPRIIVDANSKIPSRGRHFDYGETDPSPYIRATICELAASGATIAVVPCNTAHILFKRWAENSAIPVINIVRSAIELIPRQNVLVAALCSRYLSQSGLYRDHLRDMGHTPFELNETQQNTITYCIEQLKQCPQPSGAVLTKMSDVVQSLLMDGVENFILACTELSILNTHAMFSGITVIDSNLTLACAAIKAIGITPKPAK